MCAAVLSFLLCSFAVQIEGARHRPGGRLEDLVKVATVSKKELFAVVPPEDQPSLWATAITDCQKMNLTIASIETPGEDKAVRRFLLKRARSGADVSFGWTGGSDYFSEGSWYWIESKIPMAYKIGQVTILSRVRTIIACMYMSPRGGWQSHRCNVPLGLAIYQPTVKDTD